MPRPLPGMDKEIDEILSKMDKGDKEHEMELTADITEARRPHMAVAQRVGF